MDTTNHGHLPDTSQGHDISEVDIGAVGRIGFLSLAVVVVSMAAMWGLMLVFMNVESSKDTAPIPVAAQGERLPPGPRLQTTEPKDLAAYEAEKDTKLANFGWVNKADGKVHIPVQKAKELVLKRGFPPRDPAALQAAQAAQQGQPAGAAAPAAATPAAAAPAPAAPARH